MHTELRSFLGCLLVVDKTKRRSLTSFVDHPWLNEDGPARERLIAKGLPANVLVPRPVMHASSDDHGRSNSTASLLAMDEDLATAVATRLNVDRARTSVQSTRRLSRIFRPLTCMRSRPSSLLSAVRLPLCAPEILVVVADVLNNLYNDITAVYKLMQLDRSHFVVSGNRRSPSTSPEVPSTSRHTHHIHQHQHHTGPPSKKSAASSSSGSDLSTPSSSSFSTSSSDSRPETVAIVLSEPTPQPMPPPRPVLPRRAGRLAPLPSDGELVLPRVEPATTTAAANEPGRTVWTSAAASNEPRRITVVSSRAAESTSTGEQLWAPSATASARDHDQPGTIPDPVAIPDPIAMPRPLPTQRRGEWDWARQHARGLQASNVAPPPPPAPATASPGDLRCLAHGPGGRTPAVHPRCRAAPSSFGGPCNHRTAPHRQACCSGA